MKPEEFDILVDQVTERVEERLENKIESVKTPEKQVMRGSLIAPAQPEIEDDEALRKLLERIRAMMEEMIEAAISNLKNELINEAKEIANSTFNEILNDNSTVTNTALYYVLIKKLKLQKIHRAYCKADAGAAATITCYLDTDATGPEITVNCDTNGGGNLNVSVPLLKDGDELFVVKVDGDWYCLERFNIGQTAPAFVKTTPGAVTSVACWFNDSDGSGEEISVPCEIADGGNLNSAVPRIADGDKIQVAKNGSTWSCTTIFQASEDCDCYEAP